MSHHTSHLTPPTITSPTTLPPQVNKHVTPWLELMSARGKRVDEPWSKGGNLALTRLGRRPIDPHSPPAAQTAGRSSDDAITDSSLEQKLFGSRRRGVYQPPVIKRSRSFDLPTASAARRDRTEPQFFNGVWEARRYALLHNARWAHTAFDAHPWHTHLRGVTPFFLGARSLTDRHLRNRLAGHPPPTVRRRRHLSRYLPREARSSSDLPRRDHTTELPSIPLSLPVHYD